MPHVPITLGQMREVDRLMIDEYCIGLVTMMENAGRGLATLARMQVGGDVAGAPIVVLVGTGNNGGGGLVAARHLVNAGAEVRVALAVAPPLPRAVAEYQRTALTRMGVSGSDVMTEPDALPELLVGTHVVLDALIGYSLHGTPREPVATFISAANASADVLRLALDLPSGLDGDSGIPSPHTLRAHATLTLAWPKTGLLTDQSEPYVGALYVADISVPAAVYAAVGVERGNLFAKGPVVRIRRVGSEWEREQEYAGGQ